MHTYVLFLTLELHTVSHFSSFKLLGTSILIQCEVFWSLPLLNLFLDSFRFNDITKCLKSAIEGELLELELEPVRDWEQQQKSEFQVGQLSVHDCVAEPSTKWAKFST